MLGDRERAYLAMMVLMDQYGMDEMYAPGLGGLTQHLNHFDLRFQEQLPDVYAVLVANEVDVALYATEWFLRLFADSPSPATVMDIIFKYGPTEGIEQLALMYLRDVSDLILSHRSRPDAMPEVYDILKSVVSCTIVDEALLREEQQHQQQQQQQQEQPRRRGWSRYFSCKLLP